MYHMFHLRQVENASRSGAPAKRGVSRRQSSVVGMKHPFQSLKTIRGTAESAALFLEKAISVNLFFRDLFH